MALDEAPEAGDATGADKGEEDGGRAEAAWPRVASDPDPSMTGTLGLVVFVGCAACFLALGALLGNDAVLADVSTFFFLLLASNW